ncbi:AT hook Transcription Factor family [Caenorhabditis elegans]|uniref:AT hook Transcription Factor family n=1 Tax=Caenorhabditis elegans TaxID=6239 RepID=A0A168HBV3_CAEEL|nr:AT hook Transcription Factor family [Caenorhabditis elegans]SAP35627.1 AT hook Transcription Factor family [Caenorhabditis elegans]|eukprot:NP_001317859.1 AT hook Transcription Factor family [Caenorhabditis elegans]
MNADDEILRREFGQPGRSMASVFPYGGQPVHGVSLAHHFTSRILEPPVPLNGCIRATPILNQRFGPHYNRRFTQPNGAPYPLRPHSDTRNAHRVYPIPVEPPQRVHSIPPVYHRQKRSYASSVQQQKPPPVPIKQQVPVPSVPVIESIEQIPLPRPQREPLIPESNPAAWQDVHSKREEKITNQLMAKSMELDEFKKKFPDGTSIKEILTSGWYKDKLTGRLIQGKDPNMNETPSEQPSDKQVTETDLDRAMRLVNCRSHWKNSRGHQPIRPAQPNIHPMSQNYSGPRNAHQHNLLPVKIQQIQSHFVQNNLPSPARGAQVSNALPSTSSSESSKLTDDIKQEQAMISKSSLEHPRQQSTREFLMQNQMGQKARSLWNQKTSGHFSEEPTPRHPVTRVSKYAMAEFTRHTPTGTRSATPNILRKNRNTDGCPSPMGLIDHALFGSSMPPTVQSLNKLTGARSTPDTPKQLKPEEPASETPRKRQRKQILVSDHHYQSSHLYSLLQDDPVKHEPPSEKEEEQSRSSSNIVHSASQENTKFDEDIVKVEAPEHNHTPPPVKKTRGRPRKDRSQEPTAVPKHMQRMRKPKKTKLNPENDEKAEEERKALLQALPTNLLNAIQAQKAMDREQDKQPRKYTRRTRTPKKLATENQPLNAVTASLQFLQSITNIDPNVLFSGLNSEILNDEAVETVGEEKLDESSTLLPTATVVATSGNPLTLDFDNPSKIVVAPIWTDDTGPLMPISMYRTDKKIERKLMLDPVPKPVELMSNGTHPALSISSSSLPNQSPDSISIPTKMFSFVNAEDLLVPSAPCQFETTSIPMIPVHKETKPLETRTCDSIKRVRFSLDCSSKNSISTKERNLLTLKLMRKYQLKFAKFNNVLFGKPKPRQREGSISKTKDMHTIRKINEHFDSLVINCVTAHFDEQPDAITSHQHNSIVTEFPIDWESTDTGCRWFPWHERIVNNCAKDAASDMVDSKINEINSVIAYVDPMINGVTDLDVKEELSDLAFLIRTMYDNLDSKLQNHVRYGQVSLPKTFELKLKSIEQRLGQWTSVKEKFRSKNVDASISKWKVAMNNYIAATMDREMKKQCLMDSYLKLKKSIQCFDAIVDITMFASRLQVLYYHACRVYRSPLNLLEVQNIMRSVEDTEYLLLLAEVKVKLFEEIDVNPRVREQLRPKIDLIDLYMAADSMNVAKGRLRRLLRLNTDDGSIKACENDLCWKVDKFKDKCKDCDIPEIISLLPSKSWPQVIIEEESARATGEYPERTNLFLETEDFDFDYSLELPVRLFANSTLGGTLSQMCISLPQLTSIVDEKLRERAEKEKEEPKNIIQSVIPLYRQHSKFYEKRCQILIEARKQANMRKAEHSTHFNSNDQKLVNSIQRDVKMYGSVVSGDQLLDYKPGRDDEKQLDVEIQNKIRLFREQKRAEALERDRLTNLNRLGRQTETTEIKRKKAPCEKTESTFENGEIDYDNIHHGIRIIESESEESSDSDSDSDENVEQEIIDGQVISMSQKDCQKLLEQHRIACDRIREPNNFLRDQNIMRNSERIRQSDWEYEYMLDQLEYLENFEDDEIDVEEDKKFKHNVSSVDEEPVEKRRKS